MYNLFEYTLRSPPEPGSDVCLYFDGEEYGGLLSLVPSTLQHIP